MPTESFSYLIFLDEPFKTLAFLSLALAILSFWVKKSPLIWGGFLFLSTSLAYLTGVASFLGLLPLIGLLLLHLFLKERPQGLLRFSLFILATALSIGLWFHLLPGFDNWKLIEGVHLSSHSSAMKLFFNFDKPFVGLFVLAFSLPLLQTKKQWRSLMTRALPLSLLGIVLMMAPSLWAHVVAYEPKIPTLSFAFLFSNLFFVAIPEEAFLRGFVQEEMRTWLIKLPSGRFLAILFASLLFTILHVNWVFSIPFLAAVFIASLIYGTIYEITRSIEASILCHFLLNTIHFFFFTYPSFTP